MKILIYLCLLVVLLSCQDNKKEEKERSNRKSDSIQLETAFLKNAEDSVVGDSSDLYPLTSKLPFGSVYLENLDTSYGWDSPKWKNVNNLFLKIYRYYERLTSIRTIKGLDIKKINYIKLQDKLPFVDSITNSIDSIRYKFEGIGPYECYYSQINDDGVKYPPNFYEEKRLCKSSGNLILYNSVTNVANVINVYNIISEPYNEKERYFFIDKNKEIKIFQFEGDDGGLTNFYQNYSIKILDNGEIKIKELEPPIN